MNKSLATIFGADYKVSFSEKGYKDLNDQLTNNYSSIFLLVDKNILALGAKGSRNVISQGVHTLQDLVA